MKSFKRIASAAIALMLFVSGPFSTLNAETRALNVVKSSAEIISNTYRLKISDIVLESGEEFNSLKKVSNYKEACDNGVLSSELAGKSEFKVVEVPVDISSQAGFTDASMDFVLDQELTLVGYKSDENGTAMTLNNCSVISDGTHVSIKGDNNACVTENGTLLTLLIALPDNYTADKSYEVGINEETIRASMPEIPSEESRYKIESGNITVRSAYILEIQKTVKDYDSLKTASEYSNIYTNMDMSEIKPEYEEYKNNKVIEVPVNMLVNAGINTGSITLKCNTDLTFIGCLTDKNGKIITLDTTLECGVNTKKLLINNDMGTECTNTGKLATLLFILPDSVKLNYKYGISFKKNGFNFVANQTLVSGIDGYAMVKSSKPEEPTKPETDDPQNDNNPDYVLQIEKTVKNYQSLKNVSEYANAYNEETKENNIKPEYEEYKNNKVIEVPLNMLLNAGINTGTIKLEFDENLIFIGCLSDKNGKLTTLDTILECGVNTQKLLINNDMGTMCTKTGKLATLLFILPEDVEMDHEYNINFKKDGFNFVSEKNKVNGISGYAKVTLSDTPSTSEPEITTVDSDVTTPDCTTQNTVKYSTQTDTDADYSLQIEKTEKKYNSLKSVSQYRNAYAGGYITGGNMKEQYMPFQDNKVIEVPVNMLVNSGISTGIISFDCDPDLKFMGCLTDQDGTIITIDTAITCGINAQKILFNNDQGKKCVKTGTLATLLFILPDNMKMDYKYNVSFSENGFDFVTEKKKIQGTNGYAMVTDSSNVTTAEPQETQNKTTDNTENNKNADYVLEIEKIVKDYDSLKCASQYSNLYNGDIAEENIKPEYEEFKNNKVIEVPVNMLVNAGINTGTIKFEFDNDLIFIGCLTDETGKLITLDTTLECGVNTKKLLINNDGGTKCIKTGKLATLLFILPENAKINYRYNIDFKENGFNFVTDSSKINGINGYAMLTTDKPVTTEPKTPENPTTDTTENEKNADFVLEIEKTEKKYNSLKKVSEYTNVYNGEISEKNIKPEYEEYKNNKVIEVPVNMLVNAGINTGTIKLECDNDLIFIGCLTDKNGKIVTLDTTLGCGVNTKKLLINNDGGAKCVQTGKLAVLLFILPEDVKMDYKYSVNFKKDGFNFVSANNKVRGINGYAMVTDGFEETTVSPQVTDQPTTSLSQTYGDADYVVEIEKTIKNYNSLKKVSEYKNVYTGGNIEEGKMKLEYEEYKNNRVIEVPMNILVNSGITAGIISFNCAPELKFIGCLTNEDGAVITLDTSISCGINAQKILFNSDKGDKCVKTGTLATLLFILPEDVKMDYEYSVNFEENGFDFVANKKTILGIDGYAMVTDGSKETTVSPQITDQPSTSLSQTYGDGDYVLEIEKTIKNYNSLKKVSEYKNVYTGGNIEEGKIKLEYEEYKNNRVIEVPMNIIVNSGITAGIISFNCAPELKFIGCLTNEDGAVITLDTSISCGINAQKILFNSDKGDKCVKTGTLATLLFILPEDVKMGYEYSVNFEENGFDFVANKKTILGIDGYAMVTDGFEETTVSPQVTDQPTTSLSQTYGDADYVLEIEKTIKNYNSLKKVSEYQNVYTGGNIQEGKIKLEYEEYKNNRVIEVPMNILVNSGITAGIISFNCAPELKFIGCITNEDGAVITLDTSISCGINAQKILFNSDKGDKCVKTGTLSTLLFILPEDVKMDYEYNVNFEENGFDFVANKKTILGIDGYAMVTLDNNVTDKTDVTKNVTGTESDNNQTSTYNATDKTGTEVNTITDKTGTEVNTITDKTGTEVNTITDKTGTEVNTITDKTGTEVNTITDKTGTEVNTITDKTGTKVNTSTEKTGTKLNTTTEKTGTKVNTSTEKTGTKVSITTEKTGTKVSKTTEKIGTKVNTTTDKTGTKVNTSTEKTETKVNTSTEKTGTKVNTSTEKTGTKVNTSTDKTGTEVNTSTEKTGTKVNTTTEEIGTKVNTSTEKTGTKVNTSTEKTGTKVNTNTEKTGTNSGTVTQVTTTPINTDVTTIPTDITIPVNTTKLNENNDKPIDDNNPPVIIRCDNIIIVQGTRIIIVAVKLQNFNIKSYFQETVIEFDFNNYFSISDIELNYAIKTVSTRYEIIGNEVHLYNIDTTRLSSDAELFKVDIDTQNNVPVGEYNMDLNASAKRAVDYINEDGVKKVVYSEISSVKGGESTIQIKEKSSSVKEIVPGSVKITNPYKKFYYSHLNEKIDMSGLKVTADIITTYDNGQQSTEYGVDITNKISISDKAVPFKLYNDNAFRYLIDLIYTDAEIAPVGKNIGSFDVFIGNKGDFDLNHQVDSRDATSIIVEFLEMDMEGNTTINDLVYNANLEVSLKNEKYKSTLAEFAKFLGDIDQNENIAPIDGTLTLNFFLEKDFSEKTADISKMWNTILS